MPGDELHTNKSLLRWHYPDQVTGQRSLCPYSQPACRQLPLCVFNCIDQTRDRYSPVLVSIFSLSPVLTNSGTMTCAPVSTVAGLVAP